MRKGFTIVELLVASAILIVLSIGLFYTYTRIFRVGTDVPLTIKDESELKVAVLQVVRDLQGIGFGMPTSYARVNTTSPYDGTNWQNMDNDNYILSIKHSGGNSYVVFLGLMTRINDTNTGCIALVENQSGTPVFKVPTGAKSIFEKDCPTDSGKYVFIYPPNPVNHQTFPPPTPAVGFYKDPSKTWDDYIGRLYLEPSSDSECAPGTYTLNRAEGSSVFPVISCVKSFRVLYGISTASGTGMSYNSTISNIQDLLTLRLCLIAQVGKKKDTQLDPPNFSSSCISSPDLPSVSFSSEDRYYRWKVFEMDVPLRNILR